MPQQQNVLLMRLLGADFINTRGVPGGNILVDLYMEYLNCTLTDYLVPMYQKQLSSNCSPDSIIYIITPVNVTKGLGIAKLVEEL